MNNKSIWIAGALALFVCMVGCGGSGGGQGSGNSGTDGTQGEITRVFDGDWHGTFTTEDRYDSGPAVLHIENGLATGTLGTAEGVRYITGTVYSNHIISGSLKKQQADSPGWFFAEQYFQPGFKFSCRLPYAGFADKPTTVTLVQ